MPRARCGTCSAPSAPHAACPPWAPCLPRRADPRPAPPSAPRHPRPVPFHHQPFARRPARARRHASRSVRACGRGALCSCAACARAGFPGRRQPRRAGGNRGPVSRQRRVRLWRDRAGSAGQPQRPACGDVLSHHLRSAVPGAAGDPAQPGLPGARRDCFPQPPSPSDCFPPPPRAAAEERPGMPRLLGSTRGQGLRRKAGGFLPIAPALLLMQRGGHGRRRTPRAYDLSPDPLGSVRTQWRSASPRAASCAPALAPLWSAAMCSPASA